MPSHTQNLSSPLDALSVESLARAAHVLGVQPSELHERLSGSSAPALAPVKEYPPIAASDVQRLIDLLQSLLDGDADVPVTHYAPKGSITEAIVEGTNVTSYCGVRRNPVPSSPGVNRRPCDLCMVMRAYGRTLTR